MKKYLVAPFYLAASAVLVTVCGKYELKLAQAESFQAPAQHEVLESLKAQSFTNQKWEVEKCETNIVSKLLNLGSSKTIYTFSDNKDVEKIENYYDSNDCRDVIATVVYRGKYEVSASPVFGVSHIDTLFNSAEIIPFTEQKRDEFNSVVKCGHADWQVGAPINVSSSQRDQNCDIEMLPIIQYDVVTVEGNNLFFGKGPSKSNPSERPKALDLDRDTVFHKSSIEIESGEQPRAATLAGHKWEVEKCETSLVSKLLNLGSSKTVYSFLENNEIEKTENYYDSADCRDLIASVIYKGKYSVAPTPVFGVAALDTSFSSAEVVAFTEQKRDEFNAHQKCGHSDWQVGSAINVSAAKRDLRCDISALPINQFDIVSIEGNTLMFGKGSDKSQPADRPSHLDLDRTTLYHPAQ